MKSNSGDKIIKTQVDTLQVSFDNEAAWLRLQDRLESKDERRRPLWLGWVAAAMVVLGAMLWYGLSEPKQEMMVKKAAPVQALPVKQEPMIVNNENKEQVPANTVVGTKAIAVTKKNITKKKETIIAPLPDQVITTVVTPEELIPVQQTPVITAAPKPKMKLVHINDVIEDQKINEVMQKSRYAGEHDFSRKRKFMLSIEEEYTPSDNYETMPGRNFGGQLIQN